MSLLVELSVLTPSKYASIVVIASSHVRMHIKRKRTVVLCCLAVPTSFVSNQNCVDSAASGIARSDLQAMIQPCSSSSDH
jgi:hypothetical protein